MSADLTTVTKKVTEILNASAAGAWSSTIDSNNYDRVADDITESVLTGALMIARAIVSNPSHVHRNLFISATPTALTHGGELPDMAGEGDLIEIKPYSAGSFAVGQMRDVQVIKSYRDNPGSLYDTVNHDQSGSRLGGYYTISNGRFYFTGNAAQGYFPAIARSGVTAVTGLIPDEYEGTWICLAAGMTPKEGDNIFPIAQYYMQIGLADLGAIASMSVLQGLPTVEQARKARGNP